MKELLNLEKLIEHMKNKGIKFSIINEDKAKEFLEKNNYYFKLASYRENYDKYTSGVNKDKYINLEFAYLVDLSTIDMHLRYVIIKMCLDIEHFLKVQFINDIQINDKEDGYNVIKKFLNEGKNIKNLEEISRHQSSDYCKGIIEKYYPFFSVWSFMEVISFGKFKYLYSFYSSKLYHKKEFISSKFLNSISDIRNASAHSNCLINKLKQDTINPDTKITRYVIHNCSVGKSSVNKRLKNKFIYDFVVLLYVYENVVSDSVKEARYYELKNLFQNRVFKHIDYYNKNLLVKSSLEFLKKIMSIVFENVLKNLKH